MVTDLDGTLVGSVDEFPLYMTFRERVQMLRRECGARWVVCTGRTYRSFRNFFSPMKAMGLTPEVVIVRHAFIYTRTRFGYLPHVLWNLRVLLLLWLDRASSRRAIQEWHAMITRTTQGVRTVRRKRDRLWLRFRSDEAAAFAASELERVSKPYRHFRVFRYRREVDVRSVPFTKGMALQELARRLKVCREHILTIGNGHNDISLLDRAVARFTGCPANSEPEVLQAVHDAGGHIATEQSLSGVIEIIDAVTGGKVNSELPFWWENPEDGDNPRSQRKAHSAKSRSRRDRALAAVVIGTLLVVFSSFGLIPGPVGRLAMVPYRAVLSRVELVMIWLLERVPAEWGGAG